MINKLNDCLERFEYKSDIKFQGVFYGVAEKVEPWDYIVYNRVETAKKDGRKSYTDSWEVHIICENFVPSEVVHALIHDVESIKGMKFDVDRRVQYQYQRKNNTNLRVEMATIPFINGYLVD